MTDLNLTDDVLKLIEKMTHPQELKEGEIPPQTIPLNERIRQMDPTLSRIELSHAQFQHMTDFQIQDLLHAIPHNSHIQSIHLSGDMMEENYAQYLEPILNAVCQCHHLQDLFVFRGSSQSFLNEDQLARILSACRSSLRVLLTWGFDFYPKPEKIAQALKHSQLERITLTLSSTGHAWGSFDPLAMVFCNIPTLHSLSLRCEKGTQEDPIISPEGTAVLFSSTNLRTLYLENVGLTDDISDAIVATLKEVRHTTPLEHLDMKHNQFTDDALHSFATLLPINTSLKSLDLSGVLITEEAGRKLAQGILSRNTTLHYLEIEGDSQRYADEFNVSKGHTETDWWYQIDYQLRLNRACQNASIAKRPDFVDALVSLSDHSEALFHVVRAHPEHCRRPSVWPDVILT